jgi:hypothetical protein
LSEILTYYKNIQRRRREEEEEEEEERRANINIIYNSSISIFINLDQFSII